MVSLGFIRSIRNSWISRRAECCPTPHSVTKKGTAGGTTKTLLPSHTGALALCYTISLLWIQCCPWYVPGTSWQRSCQSVFGLPWVFSSLFSELGGWNPPLGCYVPRVCFSPFLCSCLALRTKPCWLIEPTAESEQRSVGLSIYWDVG